jgi:thiol-disulfide isomerase/thioredoxin
VAAAGWPAVAALLVTCSLEFNSLEHHHGMADEPQASPSSIRLRETSWRQLRNSPQKPPRPDSAPRSERDASGRPQAGSARQTTIVLVWTTTCANCLEELPDYWKLSREFQREGLGFATLNCDYDGIPGKPPSYFRPRVRKWLQDSPPAVQHWQLSDAFLDFLEATDITETPTVIILQAGRPPEFLQYEPAATARPLLIRLRDRLNAGFAPIGPGPGSGDAAPGNGARGNGARETDGQPEDDRQ